MAFSILSSLRFLFHNRAADCRRQSVANRPGKFVKGAKKPTSNNFV